MKHILTILVLFISSSLFGQLILTRNDTISVTKDTITLKAGAYRGNLFWQQSLDNKNWVTLDIRNCDSLKIGSDMESFYRAEIVEANCNSIYSETIKVEIDSIENVIHSKIEMAYPDSIGIPTRFIVNNDTINCVKINNEYVYQGDIILTKGQLQPDSIKGAALRNFNRWPENTVYYLIGQNLADNEWVRQAIKYWEDHTALRFIKYTNQKNKIIFLRDEVNTDSFLGMIDGGQVIHVADWARTGEVMHEIGHSIGLIHEHSRSDRNKFVRINISNVKEQYRSNFDLIRNSINTAEFDFNSIMMYPNFINGWHIDPTKALIVNLKDGKPYPTQKEYLSKGDLSIINYLYPYWKIDISTVEPTKILSTAATCGGIIYSDGGAKITSYGLCWNTTGQPTIESNSTFLTGEAGSFELNLTGLMANTTYYVSAFARNSEGIGYANQVTFTTGQPVTPPTVVTNSANAIAQTTANIGGNVSSDGGATVTERGFYLGTSQDMTTAIKKTADIAGIGSFSSNLTGLKANTAYYVWAYAINSAGIAYGNQVSFTTASPIITSPTVTTNIIADITQTTATSGGNITSDGGAVVTERGVCWSTSQDPSKATKIPTSGSGIGSYSCNISGLTSNTTYYVWAYAINSADIVYGNQVTFTTNQSSESGTSTFTDARDGKVYKTVKIGNQWWMAENLAYLPDAGNGTFVSGYFVYGYSGNSVSAAKALDTYSTFGVLYYHSSALTACPNGWHLPSDEEWKLMEITLGMTREQADATSLRGIDQGTQTKSTTGWNNNGNGTNSSGFSGLPGGSFLTDGRFANTGNLALWWSSTAYNSVAFWTRQLYYTDTSIQRKGVHNSYGLSVRCIKD